MVGHHPRLVHPAILAKGDLPLGDGRFAVEIPKILVVKSNQRRAESEMLFQMRFGLPLETALDVVLEVQDWLGLLIFHALQRLECRPSEPFLRHGGEQQNGCQREQYGFGEVFHH